MNSPKNICLNCGKVGHHIRYCLEPVISYGIICFNICLKMGITNKQIESYFYNKFIDISEYNYLNVNNINLLSQYRDKIKFLMIRRKNSLNYIEFLRGKYEQNDLVHIQKLFNLMTIEENLKIKNSNFDNLWNELWKETARNKIYQKEFNSSLNKFNYLKSNNFFNLLDDNNLSKFTEPEWGFPKGRRNYNEKNLNCAIREFIEETNVDISQIQILERVNTLEEEYEGTNLIKYKHIYYLASSNNNLIMYKENYEIGDIAWLSIDEAIEKIRPYHEPKKKIIYQIYFFIINIINDLIKIDNLMHSII